MYKINNNSSLDVSHLTDIISHFMPYNQKQLGWNKPVSLFFQSDHDNANKILGKTAQYDPDQFSITIFVDGRHPKDILRSLSHELVHHNQNCLGQFDGPQDAGVGYAQRDPHLRTMEREAYEKGNIIFRDFEDLIKTGKINIKLSGESKMSLKEWKNNELNGLLMKKWGFLKEGRDPWTGLGVGHHGESCAEAHSEETAAAGGDITAGHQAWLNRGGHEEWKERHGRTRSHEPTPGIEAPGGWFGPPKELEEGWGWRDEDDEDKKHLEEFGSGTGWRDEDEVEPLKGAPPKVTRKDPEWYGTSTDTKHVKKQVAGIDAARKKAHPQSRQESISRKISVREAKEITRRIIERIRKEGK